MAAKEKWVKADAATEARAHARLARDRLAGAADDYERPFVELDRVVGPDPRKVILVEQAIGDVCAQIVGRPSIPSV